MVFPHFIKWSVHSSAFNSSSHIASRSVLCVRTAVSDRRILGSSLVYYPPEARGQQGEGDPIPEAGFSVTLPESNHPKKKLFSYI